MMSAHEPGVGKDRRIQTERVKQQLCRSREKQMAFMPFFLRTRIVREAAAATRSGGDDWVKVVTANAKKWVQFLSAPKKKSHQTDLKDLFKCGEKGPGNRIGTHCTARHEHQPRRAKEERFFRIEPKQTAGGGKVFFFFEKCSRTRGTNREGGGDANPSRRRRCPCA